MNKWMLQQRSGKWCCMNSCQICLSAQREKIENTIRFKMLENKRKTALQYWLSDGTAWPELHKIALQVFSMSASSAASERNFSAFDSKQCNCLSNKSVEKLVFIKTNYQALYSSDCGDGSVWDESSDDSDVAVESNGLSDTGEWLTLRQHIVSFNILNG